MMDVAATCMCCAPSSLAPCVSSCCSVAQRLIPSKTADSEAHAAAEVPLQSLSLRVRNMAGDVIANVVADRDSSVAELKSQIAEAAAFEYVGFVQGLICGQSQLVDTATLRESALHDGDELVATRSNLLRGEFAERHIACPTCGSYETVHVAFADSCPTLEISRLQGLQGNRVFQYMIGEVRQDAEQMEISLELREVKEAEEGTEETICQAVVFVSKSDVMKRRLVIPDLDIDALDLRDLEKQRQELQEIRLSLFRKWGIGQIYKFSMSDAFKVMSNSRRWFEDGVVDHVQELVRPWKRGGEEDGGDDDEDEKWKHVLSLCEAMLRRQGEHRCKAVYGKRCKEKQRFETRATEARLLKNRRRAADCSRKTGKDVA